MQKIGAVLRGRLLIGLLLSLAAAMGIGQAGQAAVTKLPAKRAASPAAVLPGTLREDVKVDQNGALNITVPLTVPPGIQGMQPRIGLSYNSQQTSGIVGIGWSFTGLPSIERTKRIRAIDGINGTVSYDANDRFTLNGQRLIVTSGSYGGDASQYHTELESFQKVTAKGASGQGPQYFVVNEPDGRTIEFGNSVDSRIAASGRPDVRSWLVSKITDSNGNGMVVSYTTDPLGTGHSDYRGYPLQIAYTSAANHGAERFVRFVYENNPEAQRIFIGGSEVDLTARISHIQTFVGTTMVSDYRLVYETSAATGKSRLLSIAQFASADSGASSISPAQFSYAQGSLQFAGKQMWLPAAFSKTQGWDGATNPFTLADVNGDGHLDIVGFKGGVQVALGSNTAFQAPGTWIAQFSGLQGWTSKNKRMVADINGDGLADIVGISNLGVVTALSNGSAFVQSATVFPYFSSSQGWQSTDPVLLADVNGDRIMDLVGVRGGIAWVAIGSSSGQFSAPVQWASGFGSPGSDYLMADLNGDGNADLLAVGNDHSIRVALSTGHAFDPNAWKAQAYKQLCQNTPVTASTAVMVSDVNGDGLADVVAFCDAVYVTLSNGQSFQQTEKWSTTFAGPGWSSGNLRMMTDLNGDGLADLIAVNTTSVIAAISTGHGFKDGKWTPLPWGLNGGGSASITTRLMGDANGDGLMDMVGIGDLNVYVGLAAGPVPDLLTRAVRSAGATYVAAYAPLTDPTVYQETRPAARAQLQSFPPLALSSDTPTYRSASQLGGFLQVIKSLSVTDNAAVDPATAFSYLHQMSYANGEVDLNGRGWMGFAAVTTDNANGASRLIRTYQQDFPMTGKLSTTTILDRTQNICNNGPKPYSAKILSYQQVQTATGVSTPPTPVYFVGKTAERVSSFQGCTVAHSEGKSYSYDAYGNVVMTANQNLVDDKGNPLDPSTVVYTLQSYNNDTTRWHLGQPLYRKVTRSNDLSNIASFNAAKDVSLRMMTYDGNGNTLSSGDWDQGNLIFLNKRYGYDSFGNRITVTKPSGAVYNTTFDTVYRTYPVQTTVVPKQGTTLSLNFGFDPRIGKLSVLAANGVTKLRCYDAFGRLTARQGPYPDNRTAGTFDAPCVASGIAGAQPATNIVTLSARTYGWNGALPQVGIAQRTSWDQATAQISVLRQQNYDGLWRKNRWTLLNPGMPAVTWTELGLSEKGKAKKAAIPQLASATPRFILNKFDVGGRITQTEEPFGPTGEQTVLTTQAYTESNGGSTTTITRAASTNYPLVQTIRYGYFNNRRLPVEMGTKGIATTTSFGYDPTGRLTDLKSPVAQDGSRPEYIYAYDSVGRISKMQEPTRGATIYSYGPQGTLDQTTQASGSFKYAYDLIGRTILVTDSDGSTRSHTYDDAQCSFGQGRVCTSTLKNAVGVQQTAYRYSYDSYGNRTGKYMQVAVGGSTLSYATTWSFDPMKRVAFITNPDGSIVTHTYTGSLDSGIALQNGPSAVFSDFSPAGTPRAVTYGNGVTTAYTLNVNDAVNSVAITSPTGATLLKRGLQWSQLQQLTEVDDLSGASAQPLYTYTYTNLRLTAASDSSSGNKWTFGYDDAGNMIAYGDSVYTYNGTVASSATGPNAFKATFGAMGNLSNLQGTQGSLTMTYDVRNQLTSASQKGTTRYSYDDSGRRVYAVDPDGGQRIYVSPWYVDQIAGGVSRPVRSLSMAAIPIAQSQSGAGAPGPLYLHTDQQRSTILTTAGNGAPVDRFSYSPTGELLGSHAVVPLALYTGKELDTQAGGYWMGQRVFNPRLARFNQPDTMLGGPALHPDSLNDNAYVLNNPATNLDPSGHFSLSAGAAICSLVSAGVSGGGGWAGNTTVRNVAGTISFVCAGAGVIDKWILPAYRAWRLRNAVGPADGAGGGGADAAGGGGEGGAELVANANPVAVNAEDPQVQAQGMGAEDDLVVEDLDAEPANLPGAVNQGGLAAPAEGGVGGAEGGAGGADVAAAEGLGDLQAAAAPELGGVSQVATVNTVATPAITGNLGALTESAALSEAAVGETALTSATSSAASSAAVGASTAAAAESGTVAGSAAAAGAAVGEAGAAAATGASAATAATAGEVLLEVLPVVLVAL